jgi:putative ABC transport system permease protein
LLEQFRDARSVALFPAEVLNDSYVMLENVRDLMSPMAIATRVLVVLAVLTALLVGFLAQRRQFAVLRPIGAGRAYVFSVVWIEVTLLILICALLGNAFGWLAANFLSHWAQLQLGFEMPVRLGTAEGLQVVGLGLTGVLIGLLPAWLSLRRSLAESSASAQLTRGCVSARVLLA